MAFNTNDHYCFWENGKMLPNQLEKLLSDTQYNWAIFGMVLFVFLIELLIVYVIFTAV